METWPSDTHFFGEWRLDWGRPLPLGASVYSEGINFSLFSSEAQRCTLVLFHPGESEPYLEIPFPQEFRMGHVFTMTVFGLDPEKLEYAYRIEGPREAEEGGVGDRQHILLDPYAKVISGNNIWHTPLPVERSNFFSLRGRLSLESFHWKNDRPLSLPSDELVVYEMHLRGFTRHDSSGVIAPGTFEGMKGKIPYLKELGVNCVELLPIFEFDERENPRIHPQTKTPLCNYWGYNSISFYAPKAGFAATGSQNGQVVELKSLVQELHAAGIQVLLDVVFNHTAEAEDRVFSFRGLDRKIYYMLNEGQDLNYSGCGNTFNCNHPVVRRWIVDCLQYWATEYHIDGFRFDLASVLGRDAKGMPLEHPPLLEELAYDPVLANCELIAEPWDAGGLYQVGSFPSYGRWKEWNGKYRDCARRFLKGELGVVGEMVQRIMGSPDLYATTGRNPTASINFITCHDGFTLADFFSYNEKHNLENGENNQDGCAGNYSWNCGAEGETTNAQILLLRQRLQKNAMALLFVSQGIPMISMGDECGRSQRGNNNAYCHDEPWNWLDWSLPEKNTELLRFVRNMIAFRKVHPSLRQKEFLLGQDWVGSGYADISWHGIQAGCPDWSESSQTLSFLLCGRHSRALGGPDHFIYCVFNSYYNPLTFEMPVLPPEMQWYQFVNTGEPAPLDICEMGQEKLLDHQKQITLIERSCVILIGR